jgi:hypothetical protein
VLCIDIEMTHFSRIAVYWFAKVFSRIRYKSTVFWVAETKVRMGPLVLVGLDLALAVGFFILLSA